MSDNYIGLRMLLTGLINKVKVLIENATFDRTYIGVVSVVESDGYVVQYAGKSLKVKATNISMYKVGDIVRICIPMADKKKAFIIMTV